MRILVPLRALLLSVLLGLLVLELALQAVVHWAPLVLLPRFYDAYWKQRFLRVPDSNSRGFHRSHPTRGWVPVAHFSGELANYHATTDSEGLRTCQDPGTGKEPLRILVVGDSFTFGAECDDECPWPVQLRQLEPRIKVWNHGVSGYGVDQMMVTVEEELPRRRPHLVIAAFICDDLWRSTLRIREYAKPHFTLRGGQLELDTPPVPERAELLESLRNEPRELRPMTPLLLDRVRWKLAAQAEHILFPSPEEGRRCLELNRHLLLRMRRLTREAGSSFLALQLPWGRELGHPELTCPADSLLETLRDQHGVATLFPRSAFAPGTPWAPGHYQRPEAAIVAREVLGWIRKQPLGKLLEEHPVGTPDG